MSTNDINVIEFEQPDEQERQEAETLAGELVAAPLKRVQELERENNRLRRELEQSRSNVDILDDERRDLEANVQFLEFEIRCLRAEKMELQECWRDTCDELERLERLINEADKECDK